MEEVDSLLKNRVFDFSKLIDYGFQEKVDYLEYQKIILEKFKLIVNISKKQKLSYQVIDQNTKEEYLPLKVVTINGDFVGKVRENTLKIIKDIINKCSNKDVYKSNQTKEIIKYVKEKYHEEPEYLWNDENAVFRHQENKKWYGVLMPITKDKLGFKEKNLVEIIDLKIDPDKINKIVNNKNYFRGYHMNKKYWLTILLDGNVDIKDIYKLIDESYSIKNK